MISKACGIGTCLTLWLAPLAVFAEDWKSPAASRALLEQTEERKADATAARDPEKPERFVAALRLPRQLLVVRATHPSTELVAARLERAEYRQPCRDRCKT